MVKEYALETYSNVKVQIDVKVSDFKFEKPIFKAKINLPKISELDDEHYAKKYCLNRKFSVECLDKLYFAESFKRFVDEILPDNEKNLKEDDPRLIIPFFDIDGSLLAIQGRALRDSKIRYITIKINFNSYTILFSKVYIYIFQKMSNTNMTTKKFKSLPVIKIPKVVVLPFPVTVCKLPLPEPASEIKFQALPSSL
jgi:hypothetical protein